MNFGVCTPPCSRARKKILHLVSNKMLNFRPFLTLNLFLGVCMSALLMEIVHFATWKCLICGPIFILMYKYMIWGVARSLAQENSTIHEVKMPNSRPFFSLNVYDFWVLQRRSPLASYWKNCISWSHNVYFIQALFQSKFRSMIWGFAFLPFLGLDLYVYVYEFWSLHAPLPKKILHLESYKMLNFTSLFNLNWYRKWKFAS